MNLSTRSAPFRWCRILITLALAAIAIGSFIRINQNLSSQDYNLGSEGSYLFGTLNISDGLPLYPGKGMHPYYIYVLSPLHALASGSFLRIFAGKALATKVVIARLFNLFCTAASFALLFFTLLRGRRISWFAVFCALALASPRIVEYSSSGRNDLLALAIEMGALFAFLSWLKHRRALWLSIFVLMAILAIATKQTSLAIFVSGVIWFLWDRQPKAAAKLTFVFIVLSAVFFFVVLRVTKGALLEQAFWINFQRNNQHHANFLLGRPFLAFVAGFVLYALISLRGIVRALRTSQDSRLRFSALAALVSLIVSSFLILRPGGDSNDFILPLVLCIPFCATQLEHWFGQRGMGVVLGVLLLVQFGVDGYFMREKIQGASRLNSVPYERGAAKLRSQFPPYGIIVGEYADSLIVHLRAWSFHGPDVTAGTATTRVAAPKFDWVFSDGEEMAKEHEISAVVVAAEKCEPSRTFAGTPYSSQVKWGAGIKGYVFKEKPESWLCVYVPRRHAH
jgi:hypothetical protein